jgi:glycerol-3-phosphate acyltransferase PlsY
MCRQFFYIRIYLFEEEESRNAISNYFNNCRLCGCAFLAALTIGRFFGNLMAREKTITQKNNFLSTFEAFVLSYLIGSLPTAYIVVKRKSDIDIRRAGSGNVGTLNAYEVTGQRSVGLVVLAGDVLKGACGVLFSLYFWGSVPQCIIASLIGVVIGHCFPLWLKFRGGRGLAAAAGAMLVVSWMFVAMWCLCWVAGYSFSKNIHIGNITAILVSPLLGYAIPQGMLAKFSITSLTVSQILAAYCAMSAILFLRHIGPLRDLISSRSSIEK